MCGQRKKRKNVFLVSKKSLQDQRIGQFDFCYFLENIPKATSSAFAIFLKFFEAPSRPVT